MLDAGRTGLSRRALLRAAAAGCLASAASRGAFGQAGSALKIGVIGSGHIGSTVGGLWVKAGHPVMFSSRHPEELAALVQGIGALATTGTVAEAIAYGDVVFVAVPYGAYPSLAGIMPARWPARWCSMPAMRWRRATATSSTRCVRKASA